MGEGCNILSRGAAHDLAADELSKGLTMKKNDALNVVLCGCGGMANGWVTTALATPGIRLVGLFDINRKAAEAMAQRHKLPSSIVFDTQVQAIKATGADACFDVTVPAAHDKIVITALEHGCHVLGEKPMSDSMPKARRMLAAAKKARRIYAVTQNYRYNADVCSLARFVRGGRLGAVEEVHAEFFIGAHFGGFRDEMEFPLVLDMAIHTFDAARFLSGADPVTAYCHAFNPRRSWYKGDASSIAVFEMSNGVVFSYRGSWCAEGLNTPWNSRWRIIGAQGSATWDGAAEMKAQVRKPGGKHAFLSAMKDVKVPVKPMKHGGHAGLMREFVAAVRGGTKPQTSCDDNIKSLAMVHAAVKSARTRKRVKVDW